MTPEEIRENIDKNNAMIESLLVNNYFTLNKEIQQLTKTNEELAALCVDHEDDGTGVCKYCLKNL